ncbi:hypothetical protein A167_02094 [Alcanivorax sp. S71-1-4]|uniref:TIGR04211 family SH3 domain-containing protein n=1 Tax=Alcanivorax sp. S71-1-4 TaxID=1177159 RepID=UPI0013576BB7|nr:TIGR04211 family SH3 domain-containing protein [Alcanivorax sp. S71-1-4]KAF0809180.1 hypothetical protein A167_02094 [Alcanivorax sp. S71-1-4]
MRLRFVFGFVFFAALFTGMTLPATAQAAPGWIGDSIYVPVRAGAGTGFRIVHRGLRSGTQVDVLKWDTGADWVQIRVGDTEGWVEEQYMSRQPIARIQLERAQQRVQNLERELAEVRSALNEVSTERDRFSEQATELNQNLNARGEELEQLQQVAADPLRLDRANRKLNEDLSLLRTELDQVKAENALLRNDRTFQGWLFALLTIFGGMTLGWYFKSRASRQRTSWV